MNEYINKLYNNDNIKLMNKLPDDSIDLIYCDILYNTGKKFHDYDDNLGTPQQAIEWYRPRLMEMKRILNNHGNIVIHCDYNLNAYIKLLMDDIFDNSNYRNEIIWKRSNDTGSSKAKANRLPVCSDTLYWYSKTNDYHFKMPTVPYDEKLMNRFKYDDNDGKGLYYWADLKTYSDKRFNILKQNNEIKQRSSGKYSYKRYLRETNTNKALSNIWDDITRVTSNSHENCDYFSQKPKKLIERIINMLSDEGNLVADFFMGSGTTCVVAKELGRNYIGCDISEKAINIATERINNIKL